MAKGKTGNFAMGLVHYCCESILRAKVVPLLREYTESGA